MVFSDIFLVRSDLLDEKYRGMRLEDTYDGYPLHYVDLDMNQFQTSGLFDDIDGESKVEGREGSREDEKKGNQGFVSKKVYFGTIMMIFIVEVLGKLIWDRWKGVKKR